jgi:hypothetical protein
MNDAAFGAPTRRHLIALLGLGMIGAAAEASGNVGSSVTKAPRLPASLHDAEIATWQGIVGHSFRLSGGGRARLVAVEALPSSGRRPQATRGRAFAAVFETAPGAIQDDRTYRLTSALLPPVHVHFGPAIAAGRATRHIAVFN